MELAKLNDETLKQAIALKVACWQEELAGKVIHHLDFKEEYAFWKEWMHSADKHQDVRTLIGTFDNEKLVACIFASFAEVEDHENAVEINGLFVNPDYRNQRLSLKLLQAVLEDYHKIGKKAVIIYNHKYAPSNTYYKKLGGKVINTITQLDGQLEIEVFHFDILDFLDGVTKQ